MNYILENEIIKCTIASKGAELRSIQSKARNEEYLWDADPAYWNRTSPILFPFVGGLKEKSYRYNGKTYTMGQHGFARDMEFSLLEQTDTELWMELRDTEETKVNYPFRWGLKVGYRLEDNAVRVIWEVSNPDTKDLLFSIGAHPAFRVPKLSGQALRFYDPAGQPLSVLNNRIFGTTGFITDRTEEIPIPNGILPLSPELFDIDTLVIEEHQLGSVELGKWDEAGNKIDTSARSVRVTFEMPLAGFWSPPHKDAPFVCIEPWYGRCDSEDFEGELQDREFEQKLEPGGTFKTSYTIAVS